MMIRLLSFDVGIKNLAYCIVDISGNAGLQLVEWSVLNLCDDDTAPAVNTTLCCGEKLKNGKVCGRQGKYSKQSEITCERHAAKSAKYKLPQKEHSERSLKKLKMEELKQLMSGLDVDVVVAVEGAAKTKIVLFLSQYFQSTEWDTIPVPKKQNASKTDLITLGRSLHAQLSKNATMMSTVNHVIIENQISPIANRMKTIQGMIAQHFISLGDSSIEFVSSGNKLKNLVKQSTATTGYKQNKQDGIFYCEKYLKDNQVEAKWLDLLSHSHKKDDLADCFLQALWWQAASNNNNNNK